MNNAAVGERVAREVGILAGRLAVLLDGALTDSGGSGGLGALAEGRAFLHQSFQAAAGGRTVSELAGSALARPGADGPQPIDRLAQGLGLTRGQDRAAAARAVDLILLAGLPEEHEGYASVLRALHPRGEPWLSVGLAAQLLYPSGPQRLALRNALETAPLVAQGVLRLVGDGPFYERSICLAEGLWPALCGLDATPARLERFAVSSDPTAALGCLAEWLAEPRTRHAAALIASGVPGTLLVTGDGEDSLHWRGCALVRAAGREPFGLILPAAADAELQRLAAAHALVRGAVPVVRLLESETAGPPAPLLPGFPDAVVLCARPGAAPARADLPLTQVQVQGMSPTARRAMWQQALPALAADAARLAARFPVEPLTAAQAAGDLKALQAVGAGPPTADDLAASLRARAGLKLSTAVKLLHPVATWSDLVLPRDRRDQLREAVDRLRLQSTVLDDWGFLHGRAGVRGVRMLFSGPPGTGKTLSAEAMASALGTDLLVVDLSRVMSKWIGETEKNLAAVFDSAERAQAVLFFDEADALFGRRTEVSDAHDRYANLETAYLLQRLERFDGLAVLATNLRQNIDPAFSRRLEFAIELEEPDRASREAIWRAHIPPAAPLAPDVNFYELAALYPVVGGLIRNAAVAGAFLAAAEGVPIGREHLVRAMRREYAKAGRAFPGLPLGLTL